MARILCVDDDRQVLELKRAVLEKSGYGVDVSESIDEAITKLDEASYDAVVTDWWFGQHDALRVIQKAKSCKSTPVMVVSGFVADALVAMGTAADVYMEKPVNAVELTRALELLLQERPDDQLNHPAESAA